MQKLKIGFVLDDGLDSVDGVQQYVLGLGGWLTSQGHDVHYLAGQTTRQDIKGVHVMSRSLPTRFNLNRGTTPLPASSAQIKRLLDKTQFDVLHVQVPYSPFMAGRIIKSAKPRTAVIGTFHVLPHSKFVAAATRGLGTLLGGSLPRFDKMLAVSPAAADYARKVFKVSSSVLPNVVDYDKFNQAKPLSQYSDDKLTVLFLGRLVPRKGCTKLLEAVAELDNRPDLPDFRVVICGRGPLVSRLKQFVVRRKLSGRVEFAGFVSEALKPRYLASADIAVFPSTGGESFGIVLLEALASGKTAVLGGDNPGYRSVLGTRPELLFQPNNPDELVEKIAHFMQDGTASARAAAWGEQFARRFDVASVGVHLFEIYQEALRNRR